MRFVPLLPAVQDPAAFQAFRDVELELDGAPHPGWAAAAFRGLAIHALHLPARPWGDGLVLAALEALGARLEPDFLVLHASEPSGLRGTSSFFRTLEAILEQAHGRGVKVALRPEPGSAAGLAGRLKEARGEAVGFCWDASVGGDLETLSDRLLTAVHSAGADLRPLQATGYRWNMAVPGKDAADLQARIADLAARHPGVLFPSEKPTHALGRPIVPDEGVVFGSHLDRERFR
jgi:sugar phosphate isomerase/epimerase